MTDADYHDEGYDDWLAAIEDGDGFYLECENGHGSLPPRRVCPHCSSTELTEEPLPETGTVETFTVVHVPTPQFSDDAPYATAVADFGSVRLTGQVRDVPVDDVTVGTTVTPDVSTTETTGERLLVLRGR